MRPTQAEMADAAERALRQHGATVKRNPPKTFTVKLGESDYDGEYDVSPASGSYVRLSRKLSSKARAKEVERAIEEAKRDAMVVVNHRRAVTMRVNRDFRLIIRGSLEPQFCEPGDYGKLYRAMEHLALRYFDRPYVI